MLDASCFHHLFLEILEFVWILKVGIWNLLRKEYWAVRLYFLADGFEIGYIGIQLVPEYGAVGHDAGMDELMEQHIVDKMPR